MLRRYLLPFIVTAFAMLPFFFSCSKHNTAPAPPKTDSTPVPVDTPVAVADSNQTLFFGSMGHGLFAINASDGSLRWKFQTDGPVSSSPTIANGLVYFGSGNFHMYAADVKTGAVAWDHAIVYPITSSPVVSGNRLYFGGNDNKIYSLNALTGDTIWTFPIDGHSDGGESVGHGMVFVSSTGGHTYALDSATGTMLWKNDSGTAATIRLAGNLVYVLNDHGDIQAIDFTGKTVWDVPTANIYNFTSVYSNGIIYNRSAYDSLIGLDALSGARKWGIASGSTTAPCFVDNGMIFCGVSSKLLDAFDLKTGTLKWSLPVSYDISTSPVAANGVVYAASKDGYMYAVDEATGKQKWSFYDSSGDGIQSSPCLQTANGKIISSTLTGNAE